ncbi:Gfo/Idh/MocA family oxidoreductase [Neobacillus sp. PS3-34]|uniref:Gfo/Idh/MocA family protein n=1 Tax=Neobacillus sp. PS3-34 TaxID=3070678 RepID=UPI0027E04DC9|nr:Gfo/Idh/MocA family oxidoreductase [Neobacillus sp. PS3-34]WML48345.1 Gfo/Idh/MocA family oxidoreductase [Neobacillus sp. PS3-34]
MIKVAVLGAGTMGSVHADAYNKMKNVEIVGIVDIRKEVGESIAKKNGTRSYVSFDEMLDLANPDVIDICLPTYLHRDYVEKAAAAKKHIICEKPIARTLEQAREMIEITEREGVKLFIAQVVRFFPEFTRARELVLSGAVGEVGMVRTMRGGIFPQAWEDWYASFEKSGTLVVDMIIHDFDYMLWCFGDVERVFAKSQWGRELNRMDHALVSLRFKNGVIAHSEGTWAYPDGFMVELEIAGKEGIIHYKSDETSPIQSSIRSLKGGNRGVAVPESPLEKSPYQVELEHFIDCIENDTMPIVTPVDAFKALEVSLAAIKSIQTGKPVSLGGETK